MFLDYTTRFAVILSMTCCTDYDVLWVFFSEISPSLTTPTMVTVLHFLRTRVKCIEQGPVMVRQCPWNPTKTPSKYEDGLYVYGHSHCKDKTVIRPSYFYTGNPCNGEIASLYWDAPPPSNYHDHHFRHRHHHHHRHHAFLSDYRHNHHHTHHCLCIIITIITINPPWLIGLLST